MTKKRRDASHGVAIADSVDAVEQAVESIKAMAAQAAEIKELASAAITPPGEDEAWMLLAAFEAGSTETDEGLCEDAEASAPSGGEKDTSAQTTAPVAPQESARPLLPIRAMMLTLPIAAGAAAIVVLPALLVPLLSGQPFTAWLGARTDTLLASAGAYDTASLRKALAPNRADDSERLRGNDGSRAAGVYRSHTGAEIEPLQRDSLAGSSVQAINIPSAPDSQAVAGTTPGAASDRNPMEVSPRERGSAERPIPVLDAHRPGPRNDLDVTSALAAHASGREDGRGSTAGTLGPSASPPAERAALLRRARESVERQTRTAIESQLLGRAEELIRVGYISGARLLLERAAAAGSTRGAFLLAQTYDPAVLALWHVSGHFGDGDKARQLYDRAHPYGDDDKVHGHPGGR
jgi:hypothetical protein